MKCPLLCIGDYSLELMKDNPGFDCKKKECAWWDKTAGKCAVLQLAFELDELHYQLEGLVEKMPHAGQFTK